MWELSTFYLLFSVNVKLLQKIKAIKKMHSPFQNVKYMFHKIYTNKHTHFTFVHMYVSMYTQNILHIYVKQVQNLLCKRSPLDRIHFASLFWFSFVYIFLSENCKLQVQCSDGMDTSPEKQSFIAKHVYLLICCQSSYIFCVSLNPQFIPPCN